MIGCRLLCRDIGGFMQLNLISDLLFFKDYVP
jgi:hypothetical protein